MTERETITTLNAIKFMLDNDQYSDDVESALDTAIAALEQQEQDRWIPVTERLPENFEGVLAWIERNKWGDGDTPTKTQECAIGWQIDGSWHFDGYSGKGTRCIAWMPLPEKYQEDKA